MHITLRMKPNIKNNIKKENQVAKSKKPSPAKSTIKTLTKATKDKVQELYPGDNCLFEIISNFGHRSNSKSKCKINLDKPDNSHIIPKEIQNLVHSMDIINNIYNILLMSKIMHKLFELHGARPCFSLKFIGAYDQTWDNYRVEFNEENVENAKETKTMEEIEKLDYIVSEKNGMQVRVHKKSRKFLDLHYAICFGLDFPQNSFPYAISIYKYYSAKKIKEQKTPKIRDGFFEIECLLDKRIVLREGLPRTTQYLVKWKGYDDDYNQWCDRIAITRNSITEYEKTADSSVPCRIYKHKNPNCGKVIQNGDLDVYVTFNNDTPVIIAALLGIDADVLIEYNLLVHPGLSKTSKFKPGTYVYMPLDHGQSISESKLEFFQIADDRKSKRNAERDTERVTRNLKAMRI